MTLFHRKIFFDIRRERVIARNKGIFRLRILVEKGSCTCATFHPSDSLLTCAPRAGSSSPPTEGGGRESGFPHARFSSNRQWTTLGSCRYMTLRSLDLGPLANLSSSPKSSSGSPFPDDPFFFFSFFSPCPFPREERCNLRIAKRNREDLILEFFFSCCYFLLYF